MSSSIPISRFLMVAALLAIAGCTTPPVAGPPAPTPAVSPPAPAVSGPTDWRDLPLAPGRWRYVPGDPVSSARYGEDGAPASVVLRCDRSTRRLTLMRSGIANAIVVTTSSGVATYPAGAVDDGGVSMTGTLFEARDAFLDKFAFSRGRVVIGSPGLPQIAVPAWAEPARAIEDCRK